MFSKRLQKNTVVNTSEIAAQQPSRLVQSLLNVDDHVLRLPKVIEKVGLSRSSIYQMVRQGLFPKPIHLGARAVGWLESQVNSWLVQCVAQSRSGVQGGNAI